MLLPVVLSVDKRISALAMALQTGATVYDLEEPTRYAPQFGSARDPVNFAGMVAADVLRGDMPLSHWGAVDGAFVLDVREPFELAVESVPGALNIPLGQLRKRLGELPRDRELHVDCRSGQRAYLATRILLQNGFKAQDVSGGTLCSPTTACWRKSSISIGAATSAIKERLDHDDAETQHRSAQLETAAFRTSARLGRPWRRLGTVLTDVLAKSGNFTLGNVSALVGIGDDSRWRCQSKFSDCRVC